MQFHYFTYAWLICCIAGDVLAINNKPGYNVDNTCQQALCKAIFDNSAIGVRQAVKSGAAVNLEQTGQSPLFLAVVLKRVQAVECLLECGAKASKNLVQIALKMNDFKSAFIIAKNCGSEDAIYEMDGQKITLMEACLRYADYESALYLLKNGAKIPVGNNYLSYIQFHVKGALDMCKELISRGSDRNAIWSNDYLYGDDPDALSRLKLFIDSGANPNHAFNNPGRVTPLVYALRLAAFFGSRTSFMKCLLDAGANVNQMADPVPDNPIYGGMQTPLAIAISMGLAEVVELLLEHGAHL